MLNFFLYASASLIWGSTWLAIKLQLTQVPPILSVAYRFCLAALILLAYCRITRKRLNFFLRDHRFMALQGFIALVLSTLFEGYRWSINALVGVTLVLVGNLIILTPQSKYRRVMGRFKDRADLV